MRISVVVPVYNARKTIGRVIEACLQQDYGDFEIIVVDDGSTDGSYEIASRYDIKLIRQENGGPAKARNTGWRAADGEVVFFTDSDCLPRPDTLSLLAAHFREEKVGGAGGTYHIANPERLLARLIHAEIVDRHLSMPDYVNYLGSFNCAYRKRALERVGGFNEVFRTASAEDNDLSYRILADGWKLRFDNKAAVAHFHEASLRRYLKQQLNHGKWRVKLYKEHKNRKGGDSYAGIYDFIQPPLALMLLPGALFLFSGAARDIYLGLLALYSAMQLPVPFLISIKSGCMENLLMAPLFFLRGFARGLGLAAGVMRFGL